MDEFDPGKEKLVLLVRLLDPSVECVVPSRPTGAVFRVGLGKGNLKKYLSLSEDDLLDLSEDPGAEAKMRRIVEPLIKELNA